MRARASEAAEVDEIDSSSRIRCKFRGVQTDGETNERKEGRKEGNGKIFFVVIGAMVYVGLELSRARRRVREAFSDIICI